MKEHFQTENLELATQALRYAESQGITRKTAQISERNNKCEVEVDFNDVDEDLQKQWHAYLESLDIKRISKV